MATLKLGILAYGSLTWSPGAELGPIIAERKKVKTPFRVEFARRSSSRGGAPTLVPVKTGGAQVKAEILVLKEGTSPEEAADMLWRRETNRVGTADRYRPPKSPGADTVLVESLENLEGVQRVLYTKIESNISAQELSPERLAELAITSARKTSSGRDGISYLKEAIEFGIETPLTNDYEREVLRQTGTSNLNEAINKLRTTYHS